MEFFKWEIIRTPIAGQEKSQFFKPCHKVLKRGCTSIGRNINSTILCTSILSSRWHCSLILNNDGSLFVKDHKSLNGTYIDKAEIPTNREVALNDGDTIGIGVATLRTPNLNEEAISQDPWIFLLAKRKLKEDELANCDKATIVPFCETGLLVHQRCSVLSSCIPSTSRTDCNNDSTLQLSKQSEVGLPMIPNKKKEFEIKIETIKLDSSSDEDDKVEPVNKTKPEVKKSDLSTINNHNDILVDAPCHVITIDSDGEASSIVVIHKDKKEEEGLDNVEKHCLPALQDIERSTRGNRESATVENIETKDKENPFLPKQTVEKINPPAPEEESINNYENNDSISDDILRNIKEVDTCYGSDTINSNCDSGKPEENCRSISPTSTTDISVSSYSSVSKKSEENKSSHVGLINKDDICTSNDNLRKESHTINKEVKLSDSNFLSLDKECTISKEAENFLTISDSEKSKDNPVEDYNSISPSSTVDITVLPKGFNKLGQNVLDESKNEDFISTFDKELPNNNETSDEIRQEETKPIHQLTSSFTTDDDSILLDDDDDDEGELPCSQMFDIKPDTDEVEEPDRGDEPDDVDSWAVYNSYASDEESETDEWFQRLSQSAEIDDEHESEDDHTLDDIDDGLQVTSENVYEDLTRGSFLTDEKQNQINEDSESQLSEFVLKRPSGSKRKLSESSEDEDEGKFIINTENETVKQIENPLQERKSEEKFSHKREKNKDPDKSKHKSNKTGSDESKKNEFNKTRKLKKIKKTNKSCERRDNLEETDVMSTSKPPVLIECEEIKKELKRKHDQKCSVDELPKRRDSVIIAIDSDESSCSSTNSKKLKTANNSKDKPFINVNASIDSQNIFECSDSFFPVLPKHLKKDNKLKTKLSSDTDSNSSSGTADYLRKKSSQNKKLVTKDDSSNDSEEFDWRSTCEDILRSMRKSDKPVTDVTEKHIGKTSSQHKLKANQSVGNEYENNINEVSNEKFDENVFDDIEDKIEQNMITKTYNVALTVNSRELPFNKTKPTPNEVVKPSDNNHSGENPTTLGDNKCGGKIMAKANDSKLDEISKKINASYKKKEVTVIKAKSIQVKRKQSVIGERDMIKNKVIPTSEGAHEQWLSSDKTTKKPHHQPISKADVKALRREKLKDIATKKESVENVSKEKTKTITTAKNTTKTTTKSRNDIFLDNLVSNEKGMSIVGEKEDKTKRGGILSSYKIPRRPSKLEDNEQTVAADSTTVENVNLSTEPTIKLTSSSRILADCTTITDPVNSSTLTSPSNLPLHSHMAEECNQAIADNADKFTVKALDSSSKLITEEKSSFEIPCHSSNIEDNLLSVTVPSTIDSESLTIQKTSETSKNIVMKLTKDHTKVIKTKADSSNIPDVRQFSEVDKILTIAKGNSANKAPGGKPSLIKQTGTENEEPNKVEYLPDHGKLYLPFHETNQNVPIRTKPILKIDSVGIGKGNRNRVRFNRPGDENNVILVMPREYEPPAGCVLRPITRGVRHDSPPPKKKTDQTQPTTDYTEETIYLICKWNASWFEEKNKVKGEPTAFPGQIYHLSDEFISYQDYRRGMFPLLMYQLWQAIAKQYDLLQEKKQNLFAIEIKGVMSHPVKNQFFPPQRKDEKRILSQLECQVLLEKKNQAVWPREGDLVVISMWLVNGLKRTQKRVVGYILKCTVKPISPHRDVSARLRLQNPRANQVMDLTLFIREQPHPIDTNGETRFGVIKNIKSDLRTFSALDHLPSSSLCQNICDPKVNIPPSPVLNVEEAAQPPVALLNLSQKKAVVTIAKSCVEDNSMIHMVHGPPGCGKSEVIIGIIMQMWYNWERRNFHGNKQILLCAPSNSAVDDIFIRLMNIRQNMEGNKFNMVRVGRTDLAHKNVSSMTLDALAEKELRKFKELMDNDEERHLQIVHVTGQINKISLQLDSPRWNSTDKLEQLRSFEEKLAEAKAKLKSLESGKILSTGRELYMRKKDIQMRLLQNANIVATTLSSCYNGVMEEAYTKKKIKFNCCIVDEATQCTEPDTLIPLLLGVNNLVLVGDPQQLPATVLSQTAKDHGLSRSLFGRHNDWLTKKELEPRRNKNHCHFLNIQYRMHPEIAQWPSEFFYKRKLMNCERLEARSANCPLLPYVVLTHDHQQSTQEECNVEEARLITHIARSITQHGRCRGLDIGIITPYNHQKEEIRKRLDSRELPNVEVGSVDGYQGRERDVVIFSCVRTEGVGFMGGLERLNVALTRAKHSLIIIGNFQSLQRDKTWNSLLSNAKSRGVFKPIVNIHDILPIIFKPEFGGDCI